MGLLKKKRFWSSPSFLKSFFQTSHLPWGDRDVGEFCVDSRLLHQGDLFFAISGEKTDGHHFLHYVMEKQGLGAITLKEKTPESFSSFCLSVEDPLTTLQQLSSKVLEEMKPTVAVIGGSLGKTTTKHFLYHILSSTQQVGCSPKSYNGQIGLPLSILNQPYSPDILVLEMGMNEKGELKKLTQIAPPSIVAMTCIDYVHTQQYGSIEELALEKSVLLQHPKTQTCLLPWDSPFFSLLREKAQGRIVTFSLTSLQADYYLKAKENRLFLFFRGKEIASCPRPFSHSIHMSNILIAWAMALELGVSLQDSIQQVETLTLPEKRFEIIEKRGVTFINDAYNACKSSMLASLHEIKNMKASRKIAVLGSMKELGTVSERHHEDVLTQALQDCDQVFLVGPEWNAIEKRFQPHSKLIACQTTKRLIEPFLKENLLPGDLILLKGSNSLELWTLVDLDLNIHSRSTT